MNVYEIWQTRGKILRDSDYVCGRRLQLRGCHLWNVLRDAGFQEQILRYSGTPSKTLWI